ncbi:Uncharacterised protein [Streptococcus pneumoniae]|uniref:SIR2 family protein n=1 Tax=Stutzerimonas stutzeri TaxID=316 RepID=UPI0005DC30E8|nr:SIR2 family protein [Stutzerimonas stutzeri]RRV79939.1 SIR2 family protein [Stutzerimonas stutzeri]CJL00873.1 Uncharacterised protein [Streptococcus pneumoniae]
MINWPAELIDDFESKRVILFIGSGVSRNSIGADGVTKPKTWKSFLTEAATQHGLVDRVRPHLESRDYLTALDLLRNSITRDQYARIVRREYLDPRYGEAPIHESIYKLDSKIVLTPNFDKIYDVYAQSKSRGTVIIKQYHDLDLARYIRGDQRVVIKAHGSVDSIENMIFGRRDYAEARVKHRWFYEIFKALMLTHTFVFIGCGTDDPDIRLVLEDIHFSAGYAREHYFISAAGAIEEDIKMIFQETMNLRVLEYDYPAEGDHSDLSNALEELASSLSFNQ